MEARAEARYVRTSPQKARLVVILIRGRNAGEAISILREYGVSQMPVVRAEPPVMAAEVAGSVSERALLDALFVGNAKLADQVEAHMSPPLPTIGGTAGVAEAISALGDADALLVQEDGRPVGVLTRADLLTYIAAFR